MTPNLDCCLKRPSVLANRAPPAVQGSRAPEMRLTQPFHVSPDMDTGGWWPRTWTAPRGLGRAERRLGRHQLLAQTPTLPRPLRPRTLLTGPLSCCGFLVAISPPENILMSLGDLLRDLFFHTLSTKQ